MQPDSSLDAIKPRIQEAISESALAKHLKRVDVDADRDGDGDAFIRVQVKLNSLASLDDDDLLALVRKIEDVVGVLDERFASVRFSEAT